MTSTGIDPGTLRLVAQRLNHYTTPGPQLSLQDAEIECFTNKTQITYFNYQLNAQFLYSITINMLYYNPRHVSSINMLIFRRNNSIITASDIATLCKRPYSTPVESRLLCSLLSKPFTDSDDTRCCNNTIYLLKMSMLMLETC